MNESAITESAPADELVSLWPRADVASQVPTATRPVPKSASELISQYREALRRANGTGDYADAQRLKAVRLERDIEATIRKAGMPIAYGENVVCLINGRVEFRPVADAWLTVAVEA